MNFFEVLGKSKIYCLELTSSIDQRSKITPSLYYEAKIKNMGNAGRNEGEYYTPRPLIQAMIQVVKPKIGDRIYDGACDSAGFLFESYDYLCRGKLTTKELEILQKHIS